MLKFNTEASKTIHCIHGSVDGGVIALLGRRSGQVDNLRDVLGDLRHLGAHILLVQLHLPLDPFLRRLREKNTHTSSLRVRQFKIQVQNEQSNQSIFPSINRSIDQANGKRILSVRISI